MVALARLVPSLRSLLIFESVARSGSCSAAAREFNLTQPSASRNIAQLEGHLGVPGRIGGELWREQARELSAAIKPKRAAES